MHAQAVEAADIETQQRVAFLRRQIIGGDERLGCREIGCARLRLAVDVADELLQHIDGHRVSSWSSILAARANGDKPALCRYSRADVRRGVNASRSPYRGRGARPF